MKEKSNNFQSFILLFLLYLVPMSVWNALLWFYVEKYKGNLGLAELIGKYPLHSFYSQWLLLASIAALLTLAARNLSDKEKFWRWYLFFYIIFLAASVIAFLPFVGVNYAQIIKKTFIYRHGS